MFGMFHFGSYLKDSDCGPQKVVEVFAITFTLWMLADNLWTSTFPFLSSIVVRELTKLTAE